MIKDGGWPVARLIPISSASGIEAQERRAASALLSVLSAVDEFGRALLKPLGAPTGKIETFIEIPFKLNGRSLRPDGIITVSRGEKTWAAIVEVKTSSSLLEREQIDTYLDLARELDFDAVLTLSNQYTTSSSDHPVEVDRRKPKKVRIYHWSWVHVLTEAVVQKQYRGVKDPDQAFILNELIRYLSDPRSGAVAFDDMGPAWTLVREGAREGTLRKSDPNVEAIAHRWDELMRYLCLDLTKELGQDVQQVVAQSESSVGARQQALRSSLVDKHELYGEIRVPGAVGPIRLSANLRSRQVVASAKIDAPREGRSKGKVSWLLRQLQEAPEQLKVEVKVARAAVTLACNLGVARENPALLYPADGREIRQFILTLTSNMGLKRDASRGSFINTVLETTKTFYRDTLQNVRPWKAPPPKLPPKPQDEAQAAIAELPGPVKEAVERQAEEMDSVTSGGRETTSIAGAETTP